MFNCSGEQLGKRCITLVDSGLKKCFPWQIFFSERRKYLSWSSWVSCNCSNVSFIYCMHTNINRLNHNHSCDWNSLLCHNSFLYVRCINRIQTNEQKLRKKNLTYLWMTCSQTCHLYFLFISIFSGVVALFNKKSSSAVHLVDNVLDDVSSLGNSTYNDYKFSKVKLTSSLQIFKDYSHTSPKLLQAYPYMVQTHYSSLSFSIVSLSFKLCTFNFYELNLLIKNINLLKKEGIPIS